MAGSRLRPSGCGIDARPRASGDRILLELPGDHCGVEIGADAYDHVVADIDDPALTVVEPHAVLGGSARVEFDYGLIVLDDEMLDSELRAFWKHLAEPAERARQGRRLASVMACERVSAHHGPVE